MVLDQVFAAVQGASGGILEQRRRGFGGPRSRGPRRPRQRARDAQRDAQVQSQAVTVAIAGTAAVATIGIGIAFLLARRL